MTAVSIPSICRYFTWHFGYWESREIGGPKPVPIFGTMLPVLKKMTLKSNNFKGNKLKLQVKF